MMKEIDSAWTFIWWVSPAEEAAAVVRKPLGITTVSRSFAISRAQCQKMTGRGLRLDAALKGHGIGKQRGQYILSIMCRSMQQHP